MMREPSPLCEHIGAVIRERRKDLRLSLREVAERMGIVSATGIWQIEHGRSEPGTGMIVRLCRVLRISADQLLGIDRRTEGPES